jgi:hypothetical protein
MTIATWLLTCALSLSAIAAYYSIVGLAAIFGAAFWPVVLMGSVLEVCKLVVASWLYRNWHITSIALRAYLTGAVVILMVITSLGIFGFLSRAHVEQGVYTTQTLLKIEQLDQQATQHRETIQRYESQLAQLDRAISQQLDRNRTTQAMTLRRQQEAERTAIRVKLDTEQQSLQEITKRRGELKAETAVLDSKLGALTYVAELFADPAHVDVEKTVRFLILALVLVFDPLAVLMLIAANAHITNSKPSIHPPASSHPTTRSITEAPLFKLPVNPGMGEMIWHNSDGKLRISTAMGWKSFEPVTPKFVSDPTKGPAPGSVHEPQIIVQKQEIDHKEIQSVVEMTLNQWLNNSLTVAQPLDPELVRTVMERAGRTSLHPEPTTQTSPSLPSSSEQTSAEKEPQYRPRHPKNLAKQLKKPLKEA